MQRFAASNLSLVLLSQKKEPDLAGGLLWWRRPRPRARRANGMAGWWRSAGRVLCLRASSLRAWRQAEARPAVCARAGTRERLAPRRPAHRPAAARGMRRPRPAPSRGRRARGLFPPGTIALAQRDRCRRARGLFLSFHYTL